MHIPAWAAQWRRAGKPNMKAGTESAGVPFPEFSPDGKTLEFASEWQAKGRYEFNI